MVNYQCYTYWIDAITYFSVADKPHVKDAPITDTLTNYSIIHQIKIIKSKYEYIFK